MATMQTRPVVRFTLFVAQTSARAVSTCENSTVPVQQARAKSMTRNRAPAICPLFYRMTPGS
jgi:hypothetical protein